MDDQYDEEPFYDDIDYDNMDENANYKKRYKPTNVKIIQNDKNNYIIEINSINVILQNLSSTMMRYINDSKKIWDNEIEPFLKSPDCFILENISEKEYSTFINFMIEQKPYRLMLVAEARLKTRLQYLHSKLESIK